MLKDIQVTLYDIFGYLFPGFLFLAAMAILFWVIFMPSVPVSFPAYTLENWVVITIGAYIAGHMLQAIANLITPYLPSAEKLTLSKPGGFPAAVIESAKIKANSILGVRLKEMDNHLLFEVCDETVLQFGATGDRDIYIYREGFYRGLSVSCLILFLCLMIRTLISGASFNILGTIQPVSVSMWLFFDALSLITAWLSYNRYIRFGGYKVRQAIVGFLVLQAKNGSAIKRQE